MKKYIALLRGINVSGQKLIKMADLKVYLSELKFSNIRTYIQSGNVVFEASDSDEIALAKLIENKIAEKYQFEVPTMIRTQQEMLDVIARNPLEIDEQNDFSKPYVIFLENEPAKDLVEKVMAFNSDKELFQIIGREVFIQYKNGAGTTKLTNTFFESKLKTKATSRNWNTVNKLSSF